MSARARAKGAQSRDQEGMRGQAAWQWQGQRMDQVGRGRGSWCREPNISKLVFIETVFTKTSHGQNQF